MFFALSKILWFFLQPLNVAILLICGAMLALHFGRRRWATWMGMGCCAVLVIFAVLPTGYVLTQFLESRYAAPDPLPRHVDGIIMLGGVLDSDIGLAHGEPQMGGTAERLITFANLGYRYRGARLIFSSGLGNLRQNGTSEGSMAAQALSDIGFNPGRRLIIEDQSRTTYENALLSRALAKPQNGQTWLMVTSAWHMPRAMGVFEKQGWHVIPVPTDFRTGGEGRSIWRYGPGGFLDNLSMSHLALKELGGIAFYALSGKWTTPHAMDATPAQVQ